MIDLDHIIDYYINYHFTLKIKDIYTACLEMKVKRLYLVLHSYEILIVLWGAIFIFPLSNFWKAIAIGLTQHIIFDQITNPISRLGYFLTYRIAKRFDKELILKEAGK